MELSLPSATLNIGLQQSCTKPLCGDDAGGAPPSPDSLSAVQLSRPRARSFPPRTTAQLAKATADGVLISDPYELETNWDSASFVLPKAGSANDDGGW